MKAIQKNGYQRIVQFYNNSLLQTLKSIYPEINWLPWKFKKVPNGFWDRAANQKMFMDSVGKDLSLKSLSEWQNVTKATIIEKGGRGLLEQYRFSMIELLGSLYPNTKFQVITF